MTASPKTGRPPPYNDEFGAAPIASHYEAVQRIADTTVAAIAAHRGGAEIETTIGT